MLLPILAILPLPQLVLYNTIHTTPRSVLVDQAGNIVARGHNMRVQAGDPTAHAEMVAIKWVDSV